MVGDDDPLPASETYDQSMLDDFHNAPPYQYSAEVVGATGRMGSFWLIYHQQQQQDKGIAIDCPRGIAPGYLSSLDSPIYVATPSAAWSRIYQETKLSRRSDLCFVGNGIPPQEFRDCTVVVPHFAVLEVCRRRCRGADQESPQTIRTTESSPPTYIYGKHATRVAATLQQHGVNTQLVDSFDEIQVYAGLKLLWASCLWLLCHNETTAVQMPLTVVQVHEQRQEDLDRLVDELLPTLKEVIIRMRSNNTNDDVDDSSLQRLLSSSLLSKKSVNDYLHRYSHSISTAIPSKDLALSEMQERNGIFLQRARDDDHPSSYHQQLLLQYYSQSDLARVTSIAKEEEEVDRVTIELEDVGLKVWGTQRRPMGIPYPFSMSNNNNNSTEKNVVIVGGGMMGSSIALALASRRPHWNITVLEESDEQDMGKTTNASWAWLNANNKRPRSYQLLNQLGLHAWKNHPNIQHLVSWLGSLVRFREFPDFVVDGGYPLEGPLTRSRISELEPLSNWNIKDSEQQSNVTSGDNIYFFPDEGCIDPSTVVRTVRDAARNLGVQFLCGQTVTNIVYDDKDQSGSIVAVESRVTSKSIASSSFSNDFTEMPADIVVSAAGCGISAPYLGGIPLLHRPGRIECADLPIGTTKQGSENRQSYLRRILVDSVRQSHVLQRSNGEIVAGGGGKLEFGGSSSSVFSNEEMSRKPQYSDEVSLLELAFDLAPLAVRSVASKRASYAVRPMPQDGLPVVGLLGSGLYVAVTHSGITLGPLLAGLIAAEITENATLDVLQPYRPSRFDSRSYR